MIAGIAVVRERVSLFTRMADWLRGLWRAIFGARELLLAPDDPQSAAAGTPEQTKAVAATSQLPVSGGEMTEPGGDVTARLLAESGIRQLYARCVDAAWRQDTDAFVDCYADGGEWKIAGLHMRGRDEIRAGFEDLLSPNELVLMIMAPPFLEIGDGTASGRTYVTELVKKKNNEGVITIGTYYERFVRHGDRWYFQWRHFALHYYGPNDLSVSLYRHPDFGPPPNMPGADDSTVVRGAPPD